ncbi:hypothetical protein ADK55_17400 [Streptomyces sp. WM4235]|uniref:hypothetical protein n=1 Tax=Streptomyces sp. WM4235 TaxID=1415551 RepID=UPI0006B043A1|nr:hypothetical protein [Streptomyces sp. WM4235]KOU52231.1 hypothetical protein ADK55_17400 [Streptomyces sp. WM4235]
MSTGIWRWILAPRTSWAAWKLCRAGDGAIDFDVAWRQARLRRHPDEIEFRAAGHRYDGVPEELPVCDPPCPP